MPGDFIIRDDCNVYLLAPLDITLLAAQIDSMRAYHTILLLRTQREEAQL